MPDERIISHIVAASENNVIGKEGGLPWRLPDDFRFFKNTTWAMPVIMGRKTFESMGGALPGRINIVITSRKDYQPEGALIVKDIEAALAKAREAETREIFIIGGGQIFEQSLEMAHRIYLTRIHVSIDGDTHYPPIGASAWTKKSARDHPADSRHNYAFTFEVWERK